MESNITFQVQIEPDEDISQDYPTLKAYLNQFLSKLQEYGYVRGQMYIGQKYYDE